MILICNRFGLLKHAALKNLRDVELPDLRDDYYKSSLSSSFVAVTDGRQYKVLKHRDGLLPIDPIDKEEFNVLLNSALGEK